MDYDYKNLIITLRNTLVMSQMEFAEYLGVSFASVNRWEQGHFKPTTKVKRRIVELCKKNHIELKMKEEND